MTDFAVLPTANFSDRSALSVVDDRGDNSCHRFLVLPSCGEHVVTIEFVKIVTGAFVLDAEPVFRCESWHAIGGRLSFDFSFSCHGSKVLSLIHS